MADGQDLTFVFHICFIEIIFSILAIKLHIYIAYLVLHLIIKRILIMIMLMIVRMTTIINSCCSLLLVVASVDMIIVISCTQGISSSKIMFPTLYFVHHFISISWLTSIICFWNGLVCRTEAEKGVIVTNRSLSVWFLILCKDNFIW